MENHSYSSYPDSGDSSPRSREIDLENATWDEPPNYKVKFMCSYGGKIQPRPHDNQLAYVGGDTKILAVDRSIRFSGIISKLSNLCDTEVCFKYQLPGEDLDALISVTNDEDLEHMMIEYDRLHRASAKPARLRLFLFPINPPTPAEPKADWFVDALNSLPIQSMDGTSPPAAAAKQTNPDFLFGLDKGSAPPVPAANLQESAPETAVSGVPPSEISSLSDSNREDRHMGGGEQLLSQVEIQRQIQELQRLQLASQEQQPVFQRKSDENLTRAYAGEYYVQQVPEKTVPAPAAVPATMSIPAAYWQERHMTTGGYAPPPPPVPATGAEQPVYLMHPPAGMYQSPPTMRPVTNQMGQGYYAMQRMVPDVYRDSGMYGMGPPPPQQPPSQPGKMGMGGYADGGGVGLVRQPQPPSAAAGGVPVQMTAETGYTQVGYDSAGRQVYYTAPGGMVPQYQTVSAASVDVRQGGGALNPEGKLTKVSQASV
ncbi:uncharacterized protein LOC122661052 [Telopea speciosissima]|uniref:uncharacterized protein LOC122661052 n=1 Tax=Telopea speciosissima TaxID=54955 RepID=UPI001CC6F206|nr:uncharacterized protein LOC122661052 [Telopea speciosissima]